MPTVRELAFVFLMGISVTPGIAGSGEPVSADAVAAYGQLPIVFERNVGQAPPEQKYLARGIGYSMALTEHAVKLRVRQKDPRRLERTDGTANRLKPGAYAALQLELERSEPDPRITAEQEQKAVSNYFIGSDPSKWRRDIPNFGAVRYESIYRGIDWVIHGRPQQLEYDFVVAPHANPNSIKMRMSGASHVAVDEQGELLVNIGTQTLRQMKPQVFQTAANGDRERVDCRYLIHGRHVSFEIGAYDRSRLLVIDPVLSFSTYLGGSVGDYAYGIAVDNTGSVFVVGQTSSTDFPTKNPTQATNKGANAFVAKFNATGNQLVYSTFLGGSGGELASAVAIDGAGNAYVTGWTYSSDFPTVNAYQSASHASAADSEQAFVTKFNAAGDAMVFSTYLGGSGGLDSAHTIAVDSAESAYVGGTTNSPDFPVVGGIQTALRGRLSGFLTKFSSDGESLIYSTYLGGSAADELNALAIDGAGNAYAAGYTNSPDFPLVNAYQSINKAITSGRTSPTAFVSKLNSAGNALVYSTYLGGSNLDVANAIAVASSGSAYVAGYTCSTDFPTLNAFQQGRSTLCTGGPNAFVTKFEPAGTGLVYSTYLGGSGGGNGSIGDNALGVAVGSNGLVVVVGYTTSPDFPLANPLQSVNKALALSTTNAFISQLSVDGGALSFSTYLGGSGSAGPGESKTSVPFGDSAAAIALDSAGNIYLAGQTGSADFPTKNPYQSANKTTTVYGSGPNAFVTKIAQQTVAPLAAPASVAAASASGEVKLTWSAVTGATSYNVYQGTTPSGEAAAPVLTVYNGTTATLPAPPSDTSNYYEVTAVNIDGESAKSSEASITTAAPKGGGGSTNLTLLILLSLLLSMRSMTLPARVPAGRVKARGGSAC